MTRLSFSTSHGDLTVAVDGPARASSTIVLGHGAGAPLDSDFMQFFAEGLAGEDTRAIRFNFPYMERGRRSPDKQPIAEQTFREVAEGFATQRLVLGGKSYGGRIASHVAAAGLDIAALVFLGYPLHPPGRPERIRDAHLHDVSCPMLFVEGTRDPFCPLDTLEEVRKKVRAPTDLVVIADGDHSLKVRKSSGRTTEQAWSEAVAAIREWLEDL